MYCTVQRKAALKKEEILIEAGHFYYLEPGWHVTCTNPNKSLYAGKCGRGKKRATEEVVAVAADQSTGTE